MSTCTKPGLVDLKAPPPSRAELEAAWGSWGLEREQAAAKLARSSAALVVLALIGIVFAIWLPSKYPAGKDIPGAVLAVAAVVYIVAFFSFLGGMLVVQEAGSAESEASRARAMLNSVFEHWALKKINAIESDATLRAYVNAVAAQGRDLVIAEANAIDDWLQFFNQRAAMARLREGRLAQRTVETSTLDEGTGKVSA